MLNVRAILPAIALYALLAPASGPAQTTSTLFGTVKDSTGAIVPDAQVVALEERTGLTRKTSTDDTGAYSFTLLPPGRYTVTAERAGFKKIEQKGIELSVGQNLRVDLVLAVGAVTETVTVTGDVTQVDTRQATISHLMDQTRMIELPLNGRSPASLVGLLPGVTTLSVPTRPGISGITISMNGTRENAQQFLLDGAPFNAVQRSDGNPLPPPEVVSEFRVLANPYSAEFGRNAGGVFATVTKSGTNELRGTLWEFLRNDKLTARNFFAPTVPVLRQNQFGAGLGGPILLPFYDGRDRTFFFSSYQGTRIRETRLVNTAIPPTALERQGNFSQSTRLPTDPDTGQPFPGGVIPAQRIDPAAVRILDRLPPANTAEGRYVHLAARPTDQDQVMVKVDHQIREANRLSFKYWYDDSSILEPWAGGSNLPWSPGLFAVRIQTASLSDTHIFSPNLLNQLHLSFTRRNEDRYNASTFTAPDLGIRIARPSVPFPPNISVAGRFTLGTQINGKPTKLDNTFALVNTLNWVRGRHDIKIGGSWEAPSFHGRPKFDNGNFSFNGQITGVALADFLIGRPVTFTQETGREDNHRATYWAGFIQDDWRVSSRLTLNLGLRYQYDAPTYHRRDRQATILPGRQSQKFPEAPLGLLYPGDHGLPRSLYYADKNNLAPRFGLAWDVTGDGRTSLRAGYGIFYQIPPVGHSNLLDTNQPFVMSVSLTNPPSLSDPWRGRYNGGVDDPIAAFDPSPGKVTFRLPVVGFSIDPNLRSGYVQQYSLSMQRQAPWQTVVEVAYVGNQARKLMMTTQLNPAIFGPGASLANIEQRRRYSPGVLGSVMYFQGANNASYNALQASVNKRMTRGFLFSAAYTFSKVLDYYSLIFENVITTQNPDDLRSERGPASFDRRHVFAGSFVWELPRLPSGSHAVARALLDGWQMSGIWRLSSGASLTVSSGRDNSLTGVGADRPDVLRNPRLPADRPRQEKILRYFDPDAFVMNAIGRFGNAGRGIIEGPGFANVDFNLSKNFHWGERWRLQFRSEFFNLFNRVNLGSPGLSVAAPANLGRIFSAGDARAVQLALKLSF